MLVLLPDRDRAGRNDYRGAFRPEADRLRVLFHLAESQVTEIPADAPMGRPVTTPALAEQAEQLIRLARVLLDRRDERPVLREFPIEEAQCTLR